MKAYKDFIQVIKEERDASGFITHAATDYIIGKVASVGKEVEGIKKGDLVQFHRNKSVEADYGGKNYYYVNKESILGHEAIK